MNENKILKNINLSNEDLIIKNKALKEKLNQTENKVKQLQIENANYINEIDFNKNDKIKIDMEINDINKKLKITYLKYLLEKKIIKQKKILKIYFKKYNEILNQIKRNNIDDKQYKNLVDVLTTGITNNEIYKKKNEDKKKEEEEAKIKEKNNLINKRNKLLKDLLKRKIRDDNNIKKSFFTKFYYKGLINEIKNQKNVIINADPKIEYIQNNENKGQKEENIIKGEIKKEQKSSEEIKSEEPKIEEHKEIEEQKQKEVLMTEEEIKQKQEDRKKMNKINQNRRKKLKKLLEDEKKQKLQLKRLYFQRFHFRGIFFSQKENEGNNINNYFNKHLESRKTEEMRKKEIEERERQEKKERTELMEKRKLKLERIIYKINRKIVIILKNILEKWNIRAKLIGLKEINEKNKKQNKGKSRTKDKSKKPKKKKEK